MPFKKILIANRSEIARRVVRSANECGYRTISIASPHDANALYVREASEHHHLNGNTPAE
ncbi:MAG: biotin carboxylase N-terminal domain-containing protein, partial [Candidatus Kapaibacterium sp.]